MISGTDEGFNSVKISGHAIALLKLLENYSNSTLAESIVEAIALPFFQDPTLFYMKDLY